MDKKMLFSIIFEIVVATAFALSCWSYSIYVAITGYRTNGYNEIGKEMLSLSWLVGLTVSLFAKRPTQSTNWPFSQS